MKLKEMLVLWCVSELVTHKHKNIFLLLLYLLFNTFRHLVSPTSHAFDNDFWIKFLLHFRFVWGFSFLFMWDNVVFVFKFILHFSFYYTTLLITISINRICYCGCFWWFCSGFAQQPNKNERKERRTSK